MPRTQLAYPMAMIILALGLLCSIATASDAAPPKSGSAKSPGASPQQEVLVLGPGLAPIYGLVRTDADASKRNAVNASERDTTSEPGAGWSKPAAATKNWDARGAARKSAASDATSNPSAKAKPTRVQSDVEEGWIVVWADHVTDTTIEGACSEAAGADSQQRFKGSCSFRYGIQPPSAQKIRRSVGGGTTADASSSSPPLKYYPSARPQAAGTSRRGADAGDNSFPRAVAVRMTLADVKSFLSAHKGDVRYVEWDQPAHLLSLVTQPDVPSWGLDVIDNREGAADGVYTYDDAFVGQGVNAYVVDTGILANHEQFLLPNGTSRVHASAEMDFSFFGNDGIDCFGHGTHVAGTVGSTTYGIAKLVTLFSIRVLDCYGGGSMSTILAGLAWVAANHVKPAVVNLSLGLGLVTRLYDEGFRAVVAAGVTVVAAAGNDFGDACPLQPSASIIVGAVDSNLHLAWFSNLGPCVDILAPGDNILSPFINPDDPSDTTYTEWLSGTSMASPHVVGVVAAFLSRYPNATTDQVWEAVIFKATRGVISELPSDTLNAFLYSFPTIPPISIIPRWLSVTEGTSALVTVVLTAAPAATVTVTGYPSEATPSGRVVVTGDSLTFTAENWDVPQSLNLSFPLDGLVEFEQEYAFTVASASEDAAFDGLSEGVVITKRDADMCSTCGQGFLDPIMIPSLPFSYVHSNVFYRNSINPRGDECFGNAASDVTYAYTPAEDVIVSISTCAPETQFDTILEIFRGPVLVTTVCTNDCNYYGFNWFCNDGGPNAPEDICALGSDCYDCGPRDGVPVAELLRCADDDQQCPYYFRTSRIPRLHLEAGVTYYIVVDAFSPWNGHGKYRLEVLPLNFPNPLCNFTSESSIIPIDEETICPSEYWVDARISIGMVNCAGSQVSLPDLAAAIKSVDDLDWFVWDCQVNLTADVPASTAGLLVLDLRLYSFSWPLAVAIQGSLQSQWTQFSLTNYVEENIGLVMNLTILASAESLKTNPACDFIQADSVVPAINAHPCASDYAVDVSLEIGITGCDVPHFSLPAILTELRTSVLLGVPVCAVNLTNPEAPTVPFNEGHVVLAMRVYTQVWAHANALRLFMESYDAITSVSAAVEKAVHGNVVALHVNARAVSLAGCAYDTTSAPPEEATCLTSLAVQANAAVTLSNCISSELDLSALADQVAEFFNQSVPRCGINLSARLADQVESSRRRRLLDAPAVSTLVLQVQIFVDDRVLGERVRASVDSDEFRALIADYFKLFVGVLRDMGEIHSQIVIPSSATSDPHFVTSRGDKFDFNGEAGSSYCIVTDKGLQVNARFTGAAKPGAGASPADGPDARTWMDQVAILVGDDKVLIGAESPVGTGYTLAYGNLTVNGKPHSGKQGTQMLRSGVTISRKKTRAAVSVPKVGVIEVEVVRASFWDAGKGPGKNFLNLRLKEFQPTSDVHGVLGQSSLNGTATALVVGRESDYQTSDIFATDCRFNRFGSRK